jgi:hypothetical protein
VARRIKTRNTLYFDEFRDTEYFPRKPNLFSENKKDLCEGSKCTRSRAGRWPLGYCEQGSGSCNRFQWPNWAPKTAPATLAFILAMISVGRWHEFWCHTWLDGLGIISLDGRKCRRLEATIKMLKVSIAPGCDYCGIANQIGCSAGSLRVGLHAHNRPLSLDPPH